MRGNEFSIDLRVVVVWEKHQNALTDPFGAIANDW